MVLLRTLGGVRAIVTVWDNCDGDLSRVRVGELYLDLDDREEFFLDLFDCEELFLDLADSEELFLDLDGRGELFPN